jgi:hypothetical protein
VNGNCRILISHSGADEGHSILGSKAVSTGKELPRFRTRVLLPSSGSIISKTVKIYKMLSLLKKSSQSFLIRIVINYNLNSFCLTLTTDSYTAGQEII